MRLSRLRSTSHVQTLGGLDGGGGAIEAQFERTGGIGQRKKVGGLLRSVAKRVKGALTRGLVVALLVGGTFGATTAFAQVPVVNMPVATAVQQVVDKDTVLSAKQEQKLAESIAATKDHARHLWRDTPLVNADGTVNGYVEIAKGELKKWELDLEKNERILDRVLDASLIGYPVNYGMFPRTFSYDGDPYDVLVLGPPIESGTLVRGKIVGIMYMDDEKGRDMKTVISPVDAQGQPLFELTNEEMARIGTWFSEYKKPEAHKGKWSKVTGWGGADEGRRFIDVTHAFFQKGLERSPDVKKLYDDAALARPIRILITAFEPFESRAPNMSAVALEHLAQTKTSMTGATIDTLLLPVEWEKAAKLTLDRIAAFQPDLVITMGEEGGMKRLEIEKRANNASSGGRDNTGRMQNGEVIRGGKKELFTRIDAKQLTRRTDKATDALEIYYDESSSGRFVCNDLYYRLLAAHRGKDGPKIVSIHLPTINDKSKDDVLPAVRAVIRSAIEMLSNPEKQGSGALVG